MEALKKNERPGETQFTTKTVVTPPLNANVFFFFFFFYESQPIYDQTQGSNVDFLIYRLFYYISLMTRPSCKVIMVGIVMVFFF